MDWLRPEVLDGAYVEKRLAPWKGGSGDGRKNRKNVRTELFKNKRKKAAVRSAGAPVFSTADAPVDAQARSNYTFDKLCERIEALKKEEALIVSPRKHLVGCTPLKPDGWALGWDGGFSVHSDGGIGLTVSPGPPLSPWISTPFVRELIADASSAANEVESIATTPFDMALLSLGKVLLAYPARPAGNAAEDA